MQSLVPYENDQPRQVIVADEVPHQKSAAWIERGLDLFFRRKWIILAGFVIVLGATVYHTINQDLQYTAESYVMVDLGKTSVDLSRMSGDGEAPGAAANLFVKNDRSVSGELFLLRISDQLEQRVLDRLRSQAARREAASAANQDTFEAQPPIVTLRRSVDFAHERESDNIIRITGISQIPQQAVDIANFYAEEYIQLTQEANRAYLSSLKQSLEAKEQQRLHELSLIEEDIQEYLPQVNAAGLSQKATNLVNQVAALEMQRDEAMVQLQLRESMLDTLKNQSASISPALVQRISSGLNRQIEVLQEQRAELATTKSQILLENPGLRAAEDENPTLRQLNGQIRQLDTSIDSLSRAYFNEAVAAGGIAGEYDGIGYLNQVRQKIAEHQMQIDELNAKIRVIDARIATQEAELENLPDLASDLARLERSRLHAEQMYQYVVERLQETRIAEESDPGYAQLIRSASGPRFSPGSSLPRSILLGSVLGLMLGVLVAMAVDRVDTRIYKSDFFRSRGFRELGTIPDMKQLMKETNNGEQTFQYHGKNLSTGLVTLSHPHSVNSEAYRNLRNTVNSSIINTEARTILVTSPGEQEGKSTTSANLAIVMAQYGYRTLLIDADLHRPRLAKMFDVKHADGLRSVLLEESELNVDNLSTDLKNLSLLTAGKYTLKQLKDKTEASDDASDEDNPWSEVAHPSDLLGSNTMRKLLHELKDQFDLILIDSSPVLATSDSTVLSTLCDGAILVTRAGKTTEGDLEYAANMISRVGTDILGVILNGFDINMAYGLRYRYQNYMRYNYYPQNGYSLTYHDQKDL